MEGDMGLKGGLINPAPGTDNTEPVFQIPVGLPSLVRGRRVKKRQCFVVSQVCSCGWDNCTHLRNFSPRPIDALSLCPDTAKEGRPVNSYTFPVNVKEKNKENVFILL